MINSDDGRQSGSLSSLITYKDHVNQPLNFQNEIRQKLFKDDTSTRDERYRSMQKPFRRYSKENHLWEPYLDFRSLKEENVQKDKFALFLKSYNEYKIKNADSISDTSMEDDDYKQVKKNNVHFIERLEDNCLLRNINFENGSPNACAFYNNYSFIPNFHSEKPVPLIYTSCESLNDHSVYVFGGLVYDDTTDLTKELNIYHTSQKTYPFPLEDSILNDKHVKHNEDMYLLQTDTEVLEKINIIGEKPPSLCSCTATKISRRYIFYYGGFYLQDDILIDKDTGEKFKDRKVIPYNQCWIFDSYLKRFKELSLMTHPTFTTLYPLTVARFGHSTAVNILNEETLETTYDKYSRYYDNDSYEVKIPNDFRSSRSSSRRKHVIASNDFVSLFIFGGFTWDKEKERFKCLGDLWKVDLIIANRGSNDYLQFGNTVLAVPLIKENTGPSARGFHVSALIDKDLAKDFDDEDTNEDHDKETQEAIRTKFGTHNIKKDKQIFDNENDLLKDKILLIHGGHNEKNKIFGFIWKYNFQKDKWSILKTYHKRKREKIPLKFSKTSDDEDELEKPFEVQHRRTCHSIRLLGGRNLVFYSGITSILLSRFHSAAGEQDVEENGYVSNKQQRETYDLVSEDNTSIRVLDIKTKFWNFDHYTVLEHYTSLDLNIEILNRLNQINPEKMNDSVKNIGDLNMKLLKLLKKNLDDEHGDLFKFLRDFEQTFNIDLSQVENKLMLIKMVYLRNFNLTYDSKYSGGIGSATTYSNKNLFVIGGVFNNILEKDDKSMFPNIILDNIEVFLCTIACIKVPSFSKGV